MNTTKILVCLYSDANFLGISILENLLLKNCYVLIVTNEVKEWEKETGHINNNSRFSIVSPEDIKKSFNFNYSVFLGGFVNKEKAYIDYRKFAGNKNIVAPKVLSIFPFEAYSAREDSQLSVDNQSGAVYIGDLLGPRMNLNSNLMVPQLINDVLEKREMRVAIGEIFYPLLVADAAKTIAKWLFSFGPYGKEIFLLGPHTSASDFWAANQKIVRELKFVQDGGSEVRFIPRNYEIKVTLVNLDQCLFETYRWINSTYSTRPVVVKNVTKKQRKYPKHIQAFIISLLLFLILPFLLIAVSTGLIINSFKDLQLNGGGGLRSIFVAKTLYVIGGAESNILSYIPGLGLMYKESSFISEVGSKVCDISTIVIPAVKTGTMLAGNVLGDSVYDPSALTQELGADFTSVYEGVTEIQKEVLVAKDRGILSARLIADKVDFDSLEQFFKEGKVFADGLPSFLGVNKPKTYLVLFQNNMELRPTGGFIGSFGLLTFDSGRMSNLSVSDVYSADGQLRGHVEPPDPIKNYLGEANWWLRDSNWDPDFPTSAKRAEWFLDKEIDQQVDGVFSIDLNVVRNALSLTGPIFLSDYDLNITSDNLYEKTQAEAEEQSFPGSHQKASFLTALSRNLISEVQKLEGGKKISLLILLFKNLEERHIQVFLHDDGLQNAVSALDWGGEVLNPACGNNCYADLVGVTEANVGVDKANYFITRKVNLDVKLYPQSIVRRLTLNLSNSANTSLGRSGLYKVYVRVFVPGDSAITGVKAISGDYAENLKPEITQSHGRYEVGVETEILGETDKKIEFDWQTITSTPVSADNYGLYVRKQAGVSDDNWNITITPSSSTLTKNGSISYNTILRQDFFAKIKWLAQ